MSDGQKRLIAIGCAAVALFALGLEFYTQYQNNQPKGPMAPAGATGGKGAWVRAQKEGKANNPAPASAPDADQGPASR